MTNDDQNYRNFVYVITDVLATQNVTRNVSLPKTGIYNIIVVVAEAAEVALSVKAVVLFALVVAVAVVPVLMLEVKLVLRGEHVI